MLLTPLAFAGLAVGAPLPAPRAPRPPAAATDCGHVRGKGGASPNAMLADYADWVAGYSKADTTSAYAMYAKSAQQTFWGMRRSKLQPINTFAEKHLAAARSARTVLYPFGGGDFVFVSALFPTADTIVLLGLEPVGTIFDWRSQEPERRSAFLVGLGRSMNLSNRMGFFGTVEMREDFADSLVNGVVHPVLVYMRWQQARPQRMARFDPRNPEKELAPGRGGRGLRLCTRNPTTGHETVFEYVSADLSDRGLQRDSSSLAYLRRWKAPTVFLKAASYLLHRPTFSRVRTLLLEQAGAIVQDDSGMPLSALASSFPDVRVFGTYERPIALFKDRFQPDLLKRYQETPAEPIGFTFGYSSTLGASNLQYATRRTQ